MGDTTSPVPTPSADQPASPPPERRLRLWPGVVIVVLQWLALTVPGWVAPGTMVQFFGMFWGPMVAAAAFAVWWLFASRIRPAERWLLLLACAGVGTAAYALADRSIGMMGLIIYALPTVTTAWVTWLLLAPFLRWPARRAGLVVVVALAWTYFAVVRFEGVDGNFSATLRYRWQPTPEEQFLAEMATIKSQGRAPSVPVTEVVTLQPGDWPSFRGPDRDGRRPGVRIVADWQAHPPQQVWKHRIGPGWSSFTVVGNRLYTQEQRGEEEAVVCYDADTGRELWSHADAARFTEQVSGAGPRATPTFHEGKLYTQGAAGRLNCLDAATGKVLWSRDLVADSGAKVPTWGFSASPLIVDGVVTVFAGAPEGKSVLGYNAASGDLAWSAGEGQYSYCSLQRARLAGVEQLLINTDQGLTAFEPAHGKVLWEHRWPLPENMARIVQPALVGDSDVLIGTGMGNGTRRVRVSRDGDAWSAQELWTTRAIKPYFNDLVLHGGHLYGFDSNFLVCVSLEDGKGKWKARGYGNGQVLLLPDQDLLLVLSEQGEVALVEASPEGHHERGRFRALEGKTWNHPVVAHGKLFVRNSEEAACYRLDTEAGYAE